ncbi:CPBP family intramembrane glutamic endopeptidase [Viridibacterium curvum]|uniref:CPBP family intramembrane metalloprotease n=1 Tax=Viridibacterium curvum TaxID=1101404 RepID=A0ABP9QGQ8_9RHOO
MEALPPLPALLSFVALFAAMATRLVLPGKPGAIAVAVLCALMLLAGIGTLFDQRAALPLGIAIALPVLHWRAANPFHARLWLLAAIVWCVAAMLHLWPGFMPLQWTADFGRHGQPLNWHLDKGLAGLLLLMVWRRQNAPPRPAPEYLLLPCGTLLIALLAMTLGLATPDPRWLPLMPVWFIGNLFLTVVAEEALFRGLLQGALAEALSARLRNGAQLAITIAALLFGMVHLHWGWRFALLATLAGGLYGWFAGHPPRLGRAIAAHGLTNAMLLICMDSPLG